MPVAQLKTVLLTGSVEKQKSEIVTMSLIADGYTSDVSKFLSTRLAGLQMSPLKKRQLANQIQDRIASMAAKQLLHLDLKTPNILVRPYNADNLPPRRVGGGWDVGRWGTDFDIRLTDFGIDFVSLMPQMRPVCLELVMLVLVEGFLVRYHKSSAFLERINVLSSDDANTQCVLDIGRCEKSKTTTIWSDAGEQKNPPRVA